LCSLAEQLDHQAFSFFPLVVAERFLKPA
jgi:hypothetical protein